jgi:heme/copper-type cytochrome/quinol oxidase subunit 2
MRWNCALLFIACISGCAGSQQFAAIPPDIERDRVPHHVVEITAEDFAFAPEEIHVQSGTLVTLHITANGTHGFRLSAFGIDERLEDGHMKVVEFYAQQRGEYGFRCSHFCGIGHFGMTGKIIVE